MHRVLPKRMIAGLAALTIVLGACGGGSGGSAADTTTTTAAPASAFSDPADAEEAALLPVRDDCVAERADADPNLDALLQAATAAGGASQLGPEEFLVVNEILTQCSPPQLLALQLRGVDQEWITGEQRTCLATAIKGMDLQGPGYLGVLYLLNGRFEAPEWAANTQDGAIIGTSACVSPTNMIVGESLSSVMADPAQAAAVDVACYDNRYQDPAEAVNYWLQRYRRVVYREADDEAMIDALDVSVSQCLRAGVLFQASMLNERGIEISDESAQCITGALVGTPYASLLATDDPSASDLLSTAVSDCVNDAEREAITG